MTGESLKKRLLMLRKNLAEVARLINVSPQALNQTLSASDIKTGFIEKLSSTLEIPISMFFEEDERFFEIRQSGRDYVERGNIEHHGTEYNGSVSVKDSNLAAENAELKRKLIEAQEKIIKLMEDKK